MKIAFFWVAPLIFINLWAIVASYDSLHYSHYVSNTNPDTVNYHLNCTFFKRDSKYGDDVENINRHRLEKYERQYNLYLEQKKHWEWVKINEIHFDDCRIFSIPHGFFNYQAVDEIYAENCAIDLIDSSAFTVGSTVKRLCMKRNNIIELSAGLFRSAPQLSYIDFSFNIIDEIHPAAFSGIEGSLRWLNLSHNRIEKLDKETFRNLFELTVLDLSYNSINTVRLELFRLHTLVLSFNNIQELNEGSFGTTQHLSYLYLNNNKLIRINGGAFTNFKRLTEIRLNNNKLAELSWVDSILSVSKASTRFAISNNPFNCSDLTDLLQRHPKAIFFIIDLATELRNRGRNDNNETSCPPVNDSQNNTAVESNQINPNGVDVPSNSSKNDIDKLMQNESNLADHIIEIINKLSQTRNDLAEDPAVVYQKFLQETADIKAEMKNISNTLQIVLNKMTDDQSVGNDKIAKLEKYVGETTGELLDQLKEVENGFNARFEDIKNRTDCLN